MAVQFKVPKSPKRDIAASDTFLGVDLTNTGVSIDGVRSPHAPNMVRHVPGKVRKRMGYYKDILFGKDINVNYAKNTSAKARELFIDNEWVKLYDLNQTIKSKDGEDFTLYLDFKYQSEEDFYIFDSSIVVPATDENNVDDEGWSHFSGTFEAESTDTFTEVDVKSDNRQELFIKEFALMRGKDSSYTWSPAPNYFVERESNDPVYGCHFLKKGADGFDGDRIVNVNRVLNTHDTYDEFTSPTEYFLAVYQLAEIPCNEQPLYIDFDYEFTAAADLDICGSHTISLPQTSEETHYSGVIEPLVYPYRRDIVISTDRLGETYKIKNLSICYEKDENYVWSPAPEDNKEKFHITDMYSIEPKNYATVTSIEKDTAASSSTITQTFDICTDNSHAGEYQRIAFDITTSLSNSSATLQGLKASIETPETDVPAESFYFKYYIPDAEEYFTDDYKKNFKKQHIEFYAYIPNNSGLVHYENYLKTLRFEFKVSGASTKAHISISNLSVKTFSIRSEFRSSSKWYMYHVGKDFYLKAYDRDEFTKVYDDANEHVSKSFQLNNNSYIIDGKDIYQFTIDEGESVLPINQDIATIPILTIAKEPQGGGTAYKPLNVLQPGFYELFQGKASVTKYQLTFGDLDDTPCEAWVMDASGNWVVKTEDTDFTVNRETGEITFTTAPGVSPITGEDNVKILAYRTVEGYRDRIAKCTTGILFGVGGAGDRVFLTGDPEHPNWDYYSDQYDATYFPDTGYTVMGSEQSRVMGYAVVSNYLASFKDGFDQSQSVFVREGDLLKNEETDLSEPVFKLINTLQGEGVVSSYSFGYMQTEPVFLTKAGIYAITEQDITGEKYSQNRSFYLDGQLRKEPNMDKAISTIYDNQYVLSLNNKLYILDGLQATRTDKSEPYATRQYAGFVCDDVPATCIWTDDTICFGTADGRICKFYTDDTALESYNDDGKPIYACWETPDLDGSLFYKNKTFRYFAIRLMQTIKTTAKMYSRKLGVWNRLMEQVVIQNPIDFENFDFELFTFSVDTTEKVVHTKVRVKKVDKARFRIENNELNEPFGLEDLALEYIESGNYKG